LGEASASAASPPNLQALDRTQPGLPLKPGKCGTVTQDYKRNGTTTLFAALNVLNGTVIGRCMTQHRHQEFLAAIERHVPAMPFVWTKPAKAIFEKLAEIPEPSV
jgi:hypothetical protein